MKSLILGLAIFTSANAADEISRLDYGYKLCFEVAMGPSGQISCETDVERDAAHPEGNRFKLALNVCGKYAARNPVRTSNCFKRAISLIGTEDEKGLAEVCSKDTFPAAEEACLKNFFEAKSE